MRVIFVSAERNRVKNPGFGEIVYLHKLHGLARIGSVRVIDNDPYGLYHKWVIIVKK